MFGKVYVSSLATAVAFDGYKELKCNIVFLSASFWFMFYWLHCESFSVPTSPSLLLLSLVHLPFTGVVSFKKGFLLCHEPLYSQFVEMQCNQPSCPANEESLGSLARSEINSQDSLLC